jgi:hypothetical protein
MRFDPLQLDPSDDRELAFALLKAVRLSGLTLHEITERLRISYGVKLTPSGLSHAINRGTIRLQRALQILAVCGASEIRIRGLED